MLVTAFKYRPCDQQAQHKDPRWTNIVWVKHDQNYLKHQQPVPDDSLYDLPDSCDWSYIVVA